MVTIEHDGTVLPLSDLISESEIIINGTYQDTDNPINFVTEDEKDNLKPGSLIIDVSCDEGMGFYFAKPTTFKNPIMKIDKIHYYAVDHTPSYLWESASRSISAALIVYLSVILEGHKSWMKNSTIQKAINVDEGVIIKESVLQKNPNPSTEVLGRKNFASPLPQLCLILNNPQSQSILLCQNYWVDPFHFLQELQQHLVHHLSKGMPTFPFQALLGLAFCSILYLG